MGVSDTKPIIDVTTLAGYPKPIDAGGLYSVATPEGCSREVLDLEQFLDAPKRKRGKLTLFTAESFARYVNKHKVAEVTELYGDVLQRAVVALVDGHGPEVAGWAQHRATLALRPTPQWNHWAERDNTLGSQVDFAEHIETGLDEIIEPTGAEMLELAQTFHASTGVTFRQAQVLASGERQFTYSESTSANAGRSGQITVPPEFTLALAPFEGSATYKVRARLRYRISPDGLKIGYKLDRPELVIQSAFDDVLRDVEALTELTVFRAAEPSTSA